MDSQAKTFDNECQSDIDHSHNDFKQNVETQLDVEEKTQMCPQTKVTK